MDNSGEQLKFETKSVIEQKPFENPAVQSFFTKWCEINDSIKPQMISRDKWEEREEKGFLEKRPDGGHTLFIPKDLQLWEMVGVMEAIDQNTFALNPKRQTEAKEKLIELGKTFQNAGIYIAKRLDEIPEGKEIASSLAQEFYEYGLFLSKGRKLKTAPDIDTIASQNLTPEETDTVDRFLAGDTLYKSRQKRVEQTLVNDPSKKEEFFEVERQNTLAQFFRVAKKAINLESMYLDEKLTKSSISLKPWQIDTPIHNTFLLRIEKSITQKIETPKTELGASIFRRGMELLQRNMPFDKLPDSIKQSYIHWQSGEKTLREALKIDELKAKLEEIRQTGDTTKISQKEREVANKIQNTVSKFPYTLGRNNPAEMVLNQNINCVGASILGGVLFKEVGLNYLVGNIPKHSILLLIINNGEVEWRDMLSGDNNENLSNEIIEGFNNEGKPLTVKDIVEFSQKPTPEGLMFYFKGDIYKKKLNWGEKKQRQYITVFEPEYGQKLQVLNNTGHTLDTLGSEQDSLGHKQEAIDLYQKSLEMYRQSIAYSPKFSYPYNGLGNALFYLGHIQEAIEAYRQSVIINPEDEMAYYGLGRVFYHLDRNEEAMETYRQSVVINPKFRHGYNGLGNALSKLGRNQEAIKAYQQFISLADIKSDDRWIKRAEQKIAELQK